MAERQVTTRPPGDLQAMDGLERVVGKPFFVAIVFFISGFPALLYQLTWQRSLFTIYGINVEAVTVVVAGFLLGLGIGSLAGGFLSRATGVSLLAIFGTVETAIGIFGLFSLHFFALVGAQTLFMPAAATTLVVLGVLFLPTLLMGSTLPVLTAYLVRRSPSIGRSVGLLYCVNTLGSATACFACVFGLMRWLGMQGVVELAGSLNILIGVAALAEAWRTRARDGLASPGELAPATPTNTTEPEPVFGMTMVVMFAGIVGFISLSYEIMWFRAFVLSSNTAAAFALVLGTYLAGIANGSLRAQRFLAVPLSRRRAIQKIAGAICIASLLGFFLLPLTTTAIFAGLGYFFPMLIMVFVQATLFGGLFPILCECGIARRHGAGAKVSQVYLANILGSVAGTLVTGFFLMDRLSMAGLSLSVALLGIAIAVALAVYGLDSRMRLAAVAGGIIAAVLLPAGTSRLYSELYEALIYKAVPAADQQFADIVENKSGVITVNRDGVVYGGGAYDGMISVDLFDDPNGLIRPASVSLFHPDPEQVLMIGMSTGAWAQLVANHPSVKHLTVVEINPGYRSIIERYPAVASLLQNPKVEIVIDDGRRWLKRHPDARFDAILSNTTWNYRPNVTNLLSSEFVRLMQDHLRPGGIAIYNTTGSLRAQRTACLLFPDGLRESGVMVIGNKPLHAQPGRLRDVLAAYRIDGHPLFPAEPQYTERLNELAEELDPQHQPAPPEHAFLESCASVLARSAELAPITDDNMGEEWRFTQSDPLITRFRTVLGLDAK